MALADVEKNFAHSPDDLSILDQWSWSESSFVEIDHRSCCAFDVVSQHQRALHGSRRVVGLHIDLASSSLDERFQLPLQCCESTDLGVAMWIGGLVTRGVDRMIDEADCTTRPARCRSTCSVPEAHAIEVPAWRTHDVGLRDPVVVKGCN